MITDKARQVLKLALDEQTTDEEWHTAAAALIWSWRQERLTDEDLFPASDAKPPLVFMPFGKHKGKPFRVIPLDDLYWIYANIGDMAPQLRDRINYELQNRDR